MVRKKCQFDEKIYPPVKEKGKLRHSGLTLVFNLTHQALEIIPNFS
jgi:hypothetical protein